MHRLYRCISNCLKHRFWENLAVVALSVKEKKQTFRRLRCKQATLNEILIVVLNCNEFSDNIMIWDLQSILTLQLNK